MTKKLIIFDCDGVLIDSEFIANRLFAEVLTARGYAITAEECTRKFTGVNEAVARQMIMNESDIHLPEDYWTALQPDLWKAYEKDLTSLMQPVLQTLESLNIPRCVASNSSRDHVVSCLHLSKQAHYFNDSAIFSSQQVPKPKPSPDLFLFAADQMGFAPEDCIVVEDSPTGATAAIAAGMSLLLFLGGTHANSEWYRKRLESFQKPLLMNCEELALALMEHV
jgi:HAD superfamily hydrolase (TIGR01509 family)